jgi:hypothetical protein
MIYKLYCTKCFNIQIIEDKESVEEIIKTHSHECKSCNIKFNYIAIQSEGELKLKGAIDAKRNNN